MINEYLVFRKFIGLLNHLNCPDNLCAKLYDLYYKCINHKLNRLFKYTYNNVSMNIKYNNYNSNNIWIFWWQGTKNMPRIVKRCIESVRNHSGTHTVVLLTKYNIKQYAKLPNYIYHKLDHGKITLTHFSDILRFNLLHHYGGLWIDSTVYCVADLPKRCFYSLYTASGGYAKDHSNVSLGKWTSFLFGGNANQPLFIFMDKFFQLYWKSNNHLVEYFLVDYALNYAFKHNIGGFESYVDNDVVPHPAIFKMLDLINHKYNSNIFNSLKRKTPFFKLTYKKKVNNKSRTFYKYIVSK